MGALTQPFVVCTYDALAPDGYVVCRALTRHADAMTHTLPGVNSNMTGAPKGIRSSPHHHDDETCHQARR